MLVSFTLACGMVAAYGISGTILLRSSAQMEEAAARQGTQQVVALIRDRLAQLSALGKHWTSGHRICALADQAAAGRPQPPLTDETLDSLRLDLLMCVDSQGYVRFARAYDSRRHRPVLVPRGLGGLLARSGLLAHAGKPGQPVTGLVMSPRGLLMLAACPVVPSSGTASRAGLLVLGRYLDQPELWRLSELAGFPVHLEPWDPQRLRPELAAALQGQQVAAAPTGPDWIAGYRLLRDLRGHEVALLRVEMPRDMAKQAQVAVRYLLLSLLVLGLLLAVAMRAFIDRVVLSRLTRLSADVGAIATGNDLSARVLATGKDELGVLAEAINAMLERLEQSQQQLQESVARFRDIALSTWDWMWEIDAQGRYRFCSDKVQEVLGYAPEELINRTPFDHMHPDVAPVMGGVLKRILAQRQPIVNLEMCNLTRDGRRVCLLSSAVPIYSPSGEFLGYRGVSRDITAQKRRDAQVKDLETCQELMSIARDEAELCEIAWHFCRRAGVELLEIYQVADAHSRVRRLMRADQAGTQTEQRWRTPQQCRAFRKGSIYMIEDRDEDLACPLCLSPDERSSMCVPLISSGTMIGLVRYGARRPKAFPNELKSILLNYAKVLAVSLDNAGLVARLREATLRDPLSGLYNRSYLDEYLTQLAEELAHEQRPVAVLVADLDRFKYINDHYGHATGDMVLRAASAALLRSLQETDCACRYGGDELVAILPGRTAAEALAIGEQLRQAIEAEVIVIPGHSDAVRITVSVGIASYPEHTSQLLSALALADRAMYKAKAAGGNRCVAWPAVDQQAQAA
jgi:diguanylate cyclase (GGDEF)-like protein/PAS domain S-box-containing protein